MNADGKKHDCNPTKSGRTKVIMAGEYLLYLGYVDIHVVVLALWELVL